jgi:hypothetical protein
MGSAKRNPKKDKKEKSTNIIDSLTGTINLVSALINLAIAVLLIRHGN